MLEGYKSFMLCSGLADSVDVADEDECPHVVFPNTQKHKHEVKQ